MFLSLSFLKYKLEVLYTLPISQYCCEDQMSSIANIKLNCESLKVSYLNLGPKENVPYHLTFCFLGGTLPKTDLKI